MTAANFLIGTPHNLPSQVNFTFYFWFLFSVRVLLTFATLTTSPLLLHVQKVLDNDTVNRGVPLVSSAHFFERVTRSRYTLHASTQFFRCGRLQEPILSAGSISKIASSVRVCASVASMTVSRAAVQVGLASSFSPLQDWPTSTAAPVPDLPSAVARFCSPSPRVTFCF